MAGALAVPALGVVLLAVLAALRLGWDWSRDCRGGWRTAGYNVNACGDAEGAMAGLLILAVLAAAAGLGLMRTARRR